MKMKNFYSKILKPEVIKNPKVLFKNNSLLMDQFKIFHGFNFF